MNSFSIIYILASENQYTAPCGRNGLPHWEADRTVWWHGGTRCNAENIEGVSPHKRKVAALQPWQRQTGQQTSSSSQTNTKDNIQGDLPPWDQVNIKKSNFIPNSSNILRARKSDDRIWNSRRVRSRLCR